jgi:hypothetical protein
MGDMRLKRILLASAVATSLAMAFAAAPGSAASGKPSGEGRTGVGTGSSAPADAAAARSKGALTASPALSLASNQIQSRILGYVKAHGTKYSFGSYADPASGKAVIETDAPASVVSSLVSGYGSVAQVRRTETVDHYSRRDDIPAFWGGNGITLAGTAPSARCSSGYTVQNAAGARFMVTAGHCYDNGQTAVTELGGRLVGTVSGNGLPSQDMELISGQSYGSSIYVGGVDSSTGNHIASAADPVVGFSDYCHSGRTTGENCGHTVQSVTATVCTSSGCKSPVIAFTGGYLPQGGDSGSPFYVKSVSGTDKHIRGHIIAGNGTTEYAEKWSRVAARFGVSIAS